ncbi:DNA adenine methylase [Luteipulveratus flavus]|uniref:site-specific DNA-methyltransferase (adenine-specific) n=1 Tax=Luteipulveratus flavus TaxID=3031728 RepID=A0ABT6C3G2_9MICO|nr:DNA adenine methylase [Luteipulveratus sp. YIM 133296]MDF8263280.1 DNA adenine methylase [Luteipulveratus sp. YIM 133296]
MTAITDARSGRLSIRAAGRTAAVSPLRYPGGKAALATFFGDLIERLGIDNARYVEPYAGGVGAGVALLLQDRVQQLVINDVDPAVYCFWKSVVQQPDAFAARITDTALNVEEWRSQKAIYRAADESDSLALGFAFFYLNRTNRSGILNAGPIGGVNQTGNYKIDARYNRARLVERVAAIGDLAARITVLSRDGMAVARQYLDDQDAFLYIDPPYVEMGGSLYLNAFTHRDHADLAHALDAKRDGNWVLTYDPSDFIRKIYSSHDVRDYELSYSANRTGKATELMIASKPVSAVLSDR